MARTSRRNAAAAEVFIPPAAERIYKTAAYVRLSVEDVRDRKDSDSLANQRRIIEQYITERPLFKLTAVYSDNGETGVNFLRPAFQSLINECKAGKIDCVIVKDLSRLGRNYIETGEYMEKVFPFLGVRLIAINDGYDSENNSPGLVFGLKNLVNDIYAKDISRKSSAALRMKQKNGDFIGSYAAYGYLKVPGDKNKIMIDEETAPIVRQIFQWKAEGASQVQICRRLNDAGVPSPCKYRLMKGILKHQAYANSEWSINTIGTILKNPVYIGCMAQGQRNAALYECKPQKRLPVSEWVIVENTHEPIIDRDLFERVQRIMGERTAAYHANAGKYDYFKKPENVLKGLVYCADCGHPLYRYKSVTCKGKKVAYVFQCRIHDRLLDKGCPKKYMHETDLLDAVCKGLQAKIALSMNIGRMVERLNKSAGFKARLNEFDSTIEEIQVRLRRISSLRQDIYDDYSDKLLTEQEFQYAIKKYDSERTALQQRLSDTENAKQGYTQSFTPSNKWLDAFQRFAVDSELTAEMAQALIERIEVNSNNNVEVTYRFNDEFEIIRAYSGYSGEAVNA